MVAQPITAPTPAGSSCPRCEQVLRRNDKTQEPECWDCGYVDYSHTPATHGSDSILSRGRLYIARYSGDYPAMKGKLLYLEAGHHQFVNASRLTIWCPWCSRAMSYLQGKIGRSARGERYQCPENHRLTLDRDGQDNYVWR